MKVLDALTAALFRVLSRLRGKRIFHPHGVAFSATLRPLGGPPTGSRLLDSGEASPAVVRFSRSLGLPEWLADPCGVGIRVPDAYGAGRAQDFLLVSSARRRGGRHLPLPARGFGDRPYSSLLPYRIGGERGLVGAVCEGVEGAGPRLDDLRRGSLPSLTLELVIAPLFGEWRRVARIELGERLTDADSEGLGLDPSHSGGGLELSGALNRLRRPAYRGSQIGRRAPRSG